MCFLINFIVFSSYSDVIYEFIYLMHLFFDLRVFIKE